MTTPPVPPDVQDAKTAAHAHDNDHPPAAAKPPRPRLQRAIVWGAVTDDALDLAEKHLHPGSWRQLVTADQGTWDRNARQLERLKALGRVSVWCDCRPADLEAAPGTPPNEAIAFAAELGVSWVGQAERSDELTWAVGIAPDGSLVAPLGSERAREIIANPNGWTPKQQETANRMIEAGDLSVSGEQYAGPWAMVSYSAGGVGIDSITVGVAMDGDVYHDLALMIARLRERPDAEKFEHGILVWHGGGLREEAFAVLGSL